MLDNFSPFALVVDDDPIILMDACDIVEAAGFRYLEAEDAQSAMTSLRDNAGSITLLFTDIQLGDGEDGIWLARETAEHWPDIGILVSSGNVRPKEDELPEGATFLTKPFSAQVVHDRLNELLPDGKKPEPLKQKAASLS